MKIERWRSPPEEDAMRRRCDAAPRITAQTVGVKPDEDMRTIQRLQGLTRKEATHPR